MLKRIRSVWPVLVGPAVLLSAIGARACETPVYEYTIHMWDRDPYRVYYFHDGGEDPTDRAVNLYLAEAASGANPEVNIWFDSIDVSNSSALGSSIAANVWQGHKSQGVPFHVALTPKGTELPAERLDLAGAKALIHSPKRQKLVDLLCEGKQGVLLLLLGPDASENSSAKAVLQEALAEAKQADRDVGLLEVKRSDPAERWLVEQMLSVEDDLKELDHTMLFGVFGRGHILEPYLGRGITTDNMLELIAFLGGPCSCEIKAAAPGMDLLTKCDWEARIADWPQPDEYIETDVTGMVEPSPSQPTATASAGPAAPGERVVAKPKAGSPARGVASAAASKPAGTPARAKKNADRGNEKARPEAAKASDGDEEAKGEKETAVNEEGRGPSLPDPADVPPLNAEAEVRPPLMARLGLPLGIAVGVLTFAVIAGGLALIWTRREQ